MESFSHLLRLYSRIDGSSGSLFSFLLNNFSLLCGFYLLFPFLGFGCLFDFLRRFQLFVSLFCFLLRDFTFFFPFLALDAFLTFFADFNFLLAFFAFFLGIRLAFFALFAALMDLIRSLRLAR